jgi:hypothetical protein
MKYLLAALAAASIMSQALPASALYISTYAISNYSANCNNDELAGLYNWPLSDANSIRSAAVDKGWSIWTWKTDSQVTNSNFVDNYADINNADLAFFAGHGDTTGPLLGTKSGYDVDYYGNRVMHQPRYRWAQYRLKWMLMSACETMYDGDKTGGGANWWSGAYPLNRWFSVFNKNGTTRFDGTRTYQVPDGSLHSIMGSRSWSYFGPYSVGGHYMYMAYDNLNRSSGQAWHDAMYTVNNLHGYGNESVVLTAYQHTSGAVWANERLASPWGNPSSYNNMGYWWTRARNGTPTFSSWR